MADRQSTENEREWTNELNSDEINDICLDFCQTPSDMLVDKIYDLAADLKLNKIRRKTQKEKVSKLFECKKIIVLKFRHTCKD